MASQFLLPNSSATHAKPGFETAIPCMGHNIQ